MALTRPPEGPPHTASPMDTPQHPVVDETLSPDFLTDPGLKIEEESTAALPQPHRRNRHKISRWWAVPAAGLALAVTTIRYCDTPDEEGASHPQEQVTPTSASPNLSTTTTTAVTAANPFVIEGHTVTYGNSPGQGWKEKDPYKKGKIWDSASNVKEKVFAVADGGYETSVLNGCATFNYSFIRPDGSRQDMRYFLTRPFVDRQPELVTYMGAAPETGRFFVAQNPRTGDTAPEINDFTEVQLGDGQPDRTYLVQTISDNGPSVGGGPWKKIARLLVHPAARWGDDRRSELAGVGALVDNNNGELSAANPQGRQRLRNICASLVALAAEDQ